MRFQNNPEEVGEDLTITLAEALAELVEHVIEILRELALAYRVNLTLAPPPPNTYQDRYT